MFEWKSFIITTTDVLVTFYLFPVPRHIGTVWPVGSAEAFWGLRYNTGTETGLADGILGDFIDHLFP